MGTVNGQRIADLDSYPDLPKPADARAFKQCVCPSAI